jgi:hypothetical protein
VSPALFFLFSYKYFNEKFPSRNINCLLIFENETEFKKGRIGNPNKNHGNPKIKILFFFCLDFGIFCFGFLDF